MGAKRMASFTFEKQYEVTYRDSNPRQECKLESYLDFMADCGMNNEEAYGFPTIGANALSENSWVFFDYEIKLYGTATQGEYLKVVTIIDDLTKFYATRKFLIFNSSGKLIVESKVLAFLIDTKKRRPIMVPDTYFEVYGIDKEKKRPKTKRLDISDVERVDYHSEFDAHYSYLDVNNHVGNGTYLRWALGTLPLDMIDEFRVTKIKMQFEKEIGSGSKVRVITQVDGNEDEKKVTSKITTLGDKKLALIETSWAKRF